MIDTKWILPSLILVLCAGCAGRLSPPGGGGGGGGGSTGFGGGGDADRPGFGLTSGVGGETRLRFEWRRDEAGTPLPTSFALFLSQDPLTLFDDPPLLVDPEGTAAVVEGLASNSDYYAGLATNVAGTWVPAGPVLLTRTRVRVYVDPTSDGVGADGLTPGTAFNSLFLGILKAFQLGGGNVWVSQGGLAGVSVNVLDGVDIYGGFAGDFDLATRDPETHRTTLFGVVGVDVLQITLGDGPRVIDGLSIDGLGVARNGVALDVVQGQLRRVSTARCNRGFFLRSVDDDLKMALVACSAFDHDLEGLSGQGPMDLILNDCRFEGCGQEGADLNDLQAAAGELVSLVVRDCHFEGNGKEGMDVDLAASLLFGQATGGFFDVIIENSDFIRNATDGLLVDIEYELTPAWASSILIGGCRARDNGGSGFRLDLDSRSDVLIHRVSSVANGLHGLAMSSEIHDGLLTVSASEFQGNHGQGLQSLLGSFALVVSHCVVSGNQQGGVTAFPLEAVALSTVSHLQDSPWFKVFTHWNVEAGPTDLPVFLNAPTQVLLASALNGATLSVESAPSFASGVPCEMDGDGASRLALEVTPTTVRLETLPVGLVLPATLAAFPAGADVEEDWSLDAASIARDAGMPTPSGAPVDAGPFGGPFGGAPGRVEAATPGYFLGRVTPARGTPLTPNQAIELQLAGGRPDSATLVQGVSVVDAATGQAVGASATVQGTTVVVTPPGGGWTAGLVLQLHRGLGSLEGTSLAAEVAWPITVQ